jgi:hypothetical protein
MLSALLLTGYAMVVAPWAVRNTRLQGVTTIIDTMGGLNLRMGNFEHTPEDRMWDAIALQGDKSWYRALLSEFPNQSLSEGQKDKWAQRKALEYMWAHRVTTLRRSALKFADFWGLEREYAAGLVQGLYGPPRWVGLVASVVIIAAYGSLTVLFICGFWLSPPQWRLHVLLLLPVAAITAVHTVVFGHSRYHLPLVPIMAIYAAQYLTVRPDFRPFRPAIIGAALSTLLMVGSWVRQIALVDAPHIRTLFSHVN